MYNINIGDFMKKILFATSNRGKLVEVKKILNEYDIEVLSLNDFKEVPEPLEDKETFLENAMIKAKYYHELFNVAVIADDSGLCVKELNYAPGVYSARYAGIDDKRLKDDANMNKLLNELKHIPHPNAYFESVIVYYSKGLIIDVNGKVEGTIIKEKRGTNGFGYDPVFLPNGYDKTLAEMTLDEKNKLSHRSRALMKLKDHFDEIFK